MYFVPDYVNCRQEDQLFFLSDKEFMLESEVFMSEFMYADHFTIRQFLYVLQTDTTSCMLTYMFDVYASYGFSKHIVKSTIFESLLEHKSKQENKTTWEGQLRPAMVRRAEDYCKRR
jgi:hypothetical protein